MKTFLLRILLLLSISNYCFSTNIREAINKHWVREETKWKIKATEETSSLRHGSNLSVKLINLTSNTLQIEIPSGTLFTARDSSKQNMLVTHELLVDLLPHQSVTNFCTGYCCEASDGAPSDEDIYTIHKPASEKLISLSEFVNQKEFEGYGVQRAIWCISNSKNLSDISAGDTAQLSQPLLI